MGRLNLIKICCIAGFVLAEVYMVFVVMAPINPGPPGRMLIPPSMMPKIAGMESGTQPPAKVTAVRLIVCSLFFGPFGACVGLGVGLLLEGGRQKIATWRSGSRPPA